MIYSITAKNCMLSFSTRKRFTTHFLKLINFLSKVTIDPPLVEVVVEKRFKESVYYEGTITICFSKKPLSVHFEGKTLDRAIKTGFKKLIDQLHDHYPLTTTRGFKRATLLARPAL